MCAITKEEDTQELAEAHQIPIRTPRSAMKPPLDDIYSPIANGETKLGQEKQKCRNAFSLFRFPEYDGMKRNGGKVITQNNPGGINHVFLLEGVDVTDF